MVNDDNLNSQEVGGLFPRLQERFGLRADPSAMEAPFFAGAQRWVALRHWCGICRSWPAGLI